MSFQTLAQGSCAELERAWLNYQAALETGSPEALLYVRELITAYDSMSGSLYRVRAELPPDDPLRLHIEDFMATVSHELRSLRVDRKEVDISQEFRVRYQRIWKENFTMFLFTTVIFIASGLLGGFIGVYQPEYVGAIIGDGMVERIIEQDSWFHRLQENPVIGGLQIAWNNIRVAFNCFALGAVLGLGGLLMMVYNGLMLGAVMGFCYRNQFHEELVNFITGHGPLELTIIVAATFTSFIYGRVFFMRPYRLFPKRFGLAARDAGVLIVGILPWLILAAVIEAGVSPWPQIPYEYKLVVGLLATVWFWVYTFGPIREKVRS